ncbi:40S ribosomal protein S15-like [Homarus americanus]|uniref:40S ribosomal protein S15 n=1 Tax=Homarus americanus TaxID=6706 RepID=A0A8J5K2V3_HOMAM|nr:40S ribosomal protein S15-like [Homarus americanus]
MRQVRCFIVLITGTGPGTTEEENLQEVHLPRGGPGPTAGHEQCVLYIHYYCNVNLFSEQLVELFPCRQRRRFQRGLKRKHMALLKRLRKAKKECPALEKPAVVKTHLRDMIIVPEMVGSMVGVYNGKTFNQVEIKPEMISHYLAEFSITYKPVKHGRPGIGATHSSRFIPLK